MYFSDLVVARRQLLVQDPKWSIKALLRIICATFAFLAMLMLAMSVLLTNHFFFNETGPGDWTDGLGLAPAMLSLLFNLLVLAFILIYRHGKDIRPGWYVAADFIIWVLCVPATVLVVWGGWFWYWEPTIVDLDGSVKCEIWNRWAKGCVPVIYSIGGMEAVASVLLFLIFCIHFALFVLAYRDVKKRIAVDRSPEAGRYNIELQHHRTPEEHRARQPVAENRASVPPAYSSEANGQTTEDVEKAVRCSAYA